MDVLSSWQSYFTEKPEPFTREEKKAYLAAVDGISLASDAFFPFSDNIDRARKSGVRYIAQPGGSVRDDLVIEEADRFGMVMCFRFGMVMCFTTVRLFHH